ncbi:FecR domain-containing protein [Chitinophaga sp. 212800008-4]|uniref:FecR family protein n=1 Tax=unclassified Chitinophaga TaxID=2619133 RepID=UPI0030D28D03
MTRFNTLWEGYIAGTLTQEEVREFMTLLDKEETQLEEGIRVMLEEEEWNGLALPGEKEMILEGIAERVKPGRIRKLLKRLTVAAAAVFFIGAGAWYWHDHVRRDARPVAVVIKPGGSNASLTLADGSVIPLDSAGNRRVQQGSTTIQQMNGRLQYTVNSSSTHVEINTLRTPKGGQFQVVLPDGTNVWLNAASSLQYPVVFNGPERMVTLTGQAYFEVAHHAGQPFKVKVNNMVVEALGTGFDIMAYTDEATINTTLVEGAVKVSAGSENVLLKPGQQALLNGRQDAFTVKPADINKVLAWKSGLFVFNNTDLASILREVGRWYDVEIVNENNDNSKLYGGSISRKKDLRSVLRLLEADGTHHFKISGRKVILLNE